jgi:hypothetical protein
MNLSTGQILRFLGMALEAGSLIGMLSVMKGQHTEFWDRIPFDPSILLGTTFTLGLFIWMNGLRLIRKDLKRNGSR